jgi:hypothetical protein
MMKPDDLKFDEAPGKKYKKRRLCDLNFDEKRAIVISSLVDMEKYEDVARKHRINKALVSSMVQKIKKNPKYLEESLSE